VSVAAEVVAAAAEVVEAVAAAATGVAAPKAAAALPSRLRQLLVKHHLPLKNDAGREVPLLQV